MLSTLKKQVLIWMIIVISASLFFAISLKNKTHNHSLSLSQTKTARIFNFMIESIRHELSFNDGLDKSAYLTKHTLFNSWHIRIGPYNNKALISAVSSHLSHLNYQVKTLIL